MITPYSSFEFILSKARGRINEFKKVTKEAKIDSLFFILRKLPSLAFERNNIVAMILQLFVKEAISEQTYISAITELNYITVQKLTSQNSRCYKSYNFIN